MYTGAVFQNPRLRARYIRGAWAFFAVDDIKRDCVTLFELIKSYTLQFFRVKKEVLRFAFTGNETKSTVRESFDSSFHLFAFCW